MNSTDEESVSVFVISYSGALFELINCFYLSYLIFWPWKTWTGSELTVVLDEENVMDRMLGHTFASLPGRINVQYSKLPPNHEQVFPGRMRTVGYDRQQYMGFYADKFTDKEYIGIVDSDSHFAVHVQHRDLFVRGKPRMIGYNGKIDSGWVTATDKSLGPPYKHISTFMVVLGFPVLIRREHFQAIRDHVTKTLKKDTFEQAFYEIALSGNYCQFDIMGNYLWWFKRDSYSWFLRDMTNSNSKFFTMGRETADPDVLSRNVPMYGLMKHEGGNHEITASWVLNLGETLCMEDNFKSHACSRDRDYITRSRPQTGKFYYSDIIRALCSDHPPETNWPGCEDIVRHRLNIQ